MEALIEWLLPPGLGLGVVWLLVIAAGCTSAVTASLGIGGGVMLLAIMALEDHGLAPGQGPVLVTGAAGGVGSVATAVLAKLGHEVAAVDGRTLATVLKALGIRP